MMKVALVLEMFDPARGGLERWTADFADALCRRGIEVAVVATGWGKGVTEGPWECVQVHGSGADVLSRAARGVGADVVHDMGFGSDADLFHPHGGCTLAAREHNLLRIPKWRRAAFLRERRYRLAETAEAARLRTGKCIVCVSKMVKGHFAAHYGLAGERFVVIPNGPDVERWNPGARLARRDEARWRFGVEGRFVAVMVAQNPRLKNAEGAIAALAGWDQSVFLLAGGGRTGLAERAAKRAHLEMRCVGVLEDAMDAYAAADVLIHPTWYDPCSLVVLEAMACGLPVITSHYNGVAERIEDGQSGFVVSADRPEEAWLALERLRDEGERERVGANARAVAESYDFGAQVEDLVALYGRIVEVRQR